MIRTSLIATVRSNGKQSENLICIETGLSIRLSTIKEFLDSLGVKITEYAHRTVPNFVNYYLDFPDQESFDMYVTYCNLIG